MKGRKRQLATDSEGFPIRFFVHRANDQDKSAIKLLLARIPLFKRWKQVLVDQGYESAAIEAHCANLYGVDYEVVKRSGKGFELLPRRWVVERTFAWLGKYRRLSKDYEQLLSVSESFLYFCSINLLVRRLAKLRF